MFAQAWYLDNGSYVTCNSPQVTIKVNNEVPKPPVTEKLVLYLNPFYWEGPINTNANFRVTVMIEDSAGQSHDVTAATSFLWTKTIGVIEPAKNIVNFKSGTTVGTGSIKVRAVYQDKINEGVVNIKVLADTSQTTTAASDYTATTATGTSGATNQTFQNATDVAKAEPDPQAIACLKQALGDAKYADFLAGKAKPTAAELKNAWQCFSQTNYIVPVYLAPVAPADVKNLPKNEAIKVAKISNSTAKNNDGTDKQVLVLSGTSTPDSKILIYIFSDPLVLAATTDSEGNWSYQLENALEPGSHEAYVAIDKEGSGDYTASKPLVFDIARAEATSDNPSGASLVLASGNPYWQNSYVLYALIVLVLALIFVFFFIRFRKKAVKISDVV